MSQNTTGHTEGPWVAQPGTTTGQEIIAPNAPKTRRVIARCGGSDREGNARLIAAAPDMLAALREAEQQIVYLHEKFAVTGSGEAALSKIRTALSKAEAR